MNEKSLRQGGNPAVFFFTGACVYKTVGGISRPVFHDCEECEACNLLKGYQCYGEICCPYHQENFLFHTENETPDLSETLVAIYQTTQSYFSEDLTLNAGE